MTQETTQGQNQNFFDIFSDAPFGPEVEWQRILDEQEAKERKTLVAQIREEIAAIQSQHAERRAGK